MHFHEAPGLNVPGFSLRNCWYRTWSHTIPSVFCLHNWKKQTQKSNRNQKPNPKIFNPLSTMLFVPAWMFDEVSLLFTKWFNKTLLGVLISYCRWNDLVNTTVLICCSKYSSFFILDNLTFLNRIFEPNKLILEVPGNEVVHTNSSLVCTVERVLSTPSL